MQSHDQPENAEQRRTQEIETAHARMRGHVGELRRLAQQGAPATSLFPYLDQLEADLNTARPEHVGWSNYRENDSTQGVVTSPTGLSGAPGTGAGRVEAIPFSERDRELQEAGRQRDGQPVGEDGLTESERARGDEPHSHDEADERHDEGVL